MIDSVDNIALGIFIVLSIFVVTMLLIGMAGDLIDGIRVGRLTRDMEEEMRQRAKDQAKPS